MQLSAEELRRLLDYDPETGVFTWRAPNSRRVSQGAQAGSRHNAGYVSVRIYGRRYLAHRLAWLYVYGEWPPEQVDHINGIRNDNRIANLRLATASQNNANRGPTVRNSSGLKGVRWVGAGKWQARIKQKSLGCFARAEDAAKAYRRAAIEHFGEFARS